MYPPPFAGVGIYIKRTIGLLDAEKITYHLFNHGTFKSKNISPTYRKYSWWIRFFIYSLINRKEINRNQTLFHLHIISYFQYIFIYFYNKFITNRIIISIHNQNALSYSKIQFALFVLILSKLKVIGIFSVSRKLSWILRKNGIQAIFVSPFIPFKVKNRIDISNKDPKIKYLSTSLGGFDDYFIKRYGLDILLKALDHFQDICLYIFLSSNKKGYQIDYLKKYVLNEELLNRIVLIKNQKLTDYLHNFIAYIRPNREDGYGISVAESIFLEIPTIASDVCHRPRGTYVFKNEDVEDLKSNIILILNNPKLSFNQKMKIEKEYDLIKTYKTFIQKK